MILRSLKTGFVSAMHNWQLTIILLFASTLIALPTALPVVSTIIQTTAFRAAGPRLLSDSLDPVWLIDLANGQFAGISPTTFSTQFIVTLFSMAFAFLLLNVVLTGGVLEVLTTRDESSTTRRFFSGMGKYLWRFLRLWVISLGVYGAAFFVYLILLAVIDGYEETAVAEGPIVIAKWIAALALAGTFAVINMVFTYARIATVVHNNSSMLRETRLAIGFVARNLLKTSVVYLAVLGTGLLLFGILAGLRGLVEQNSSGMAMLAWVIGQLAIAGRVWARVGSYAAGVEMYRALNPMSEVVPTLVKLTPEFAAAIDSDSAL